MDVITDVIDSILMPPPPPRLSKRQRLESSALDPAAVIPPAPGQSTSHDSMFSHHLHQDCTAVHPFHNNSGRGKGRRYVSPDEIDTKMIAGVGNSGGGVGGERSKGNNLDLAASNSFFVAGVEKKLEGTFDGLANTTNTTTRVMHSNEEENRHHEEFRPASQNYDPPAVSECEGKEGEEPTVDANDFTTKRDKMQPPHGYDIPTINASFRDIIGHGQAKLRLDEALLPLALPPDLAASVLSGIRAAPASILLHGPPGCGKTKLAKAVAGEAQAAFISVGPSDILSKFVGESESAIRGLFREARARAKKMESKCTVIFFDEIDALGRSRVDEGNGGESKSGGDHSSRRVLAELLIQMTDLSSMNGEDDGGESECDEDYDGYCDDNSFACQSTLSGSEVVVACHDGNLNERSQALNAGDKVRTTPRVIVIAATNRPEDCDPALLRRFAVRVLVGLPTKKDRKKIIKRLLKDVDHTVTADQLDELADATEGWSGSDLGECQLSISCAISLLLCIVLLF
ncbi:hypothetical protein ACHAXM_006170 [Skeletonema potamos]